MSETNRTQSEQEALWAGSFGDDYIQRNDRNNPRWNSAAFFARNLSRTGGVRSILEFGPNVGSNLDSIHRLLPQVELHAVEINPTAAERLRGLGFLAEVHQGSALDFQPARTYDLTFTKGVLIHMNPDDLPSMYDVMHAASSRYILLAEYYNPTPVAVPYRGHGNQLFKRDFAGEFLDRHPDTRLVDYGFAYRRDNTFPMDDFTWFLLEKVGR
jgi:spore coat polysaccharide biosynthesis protein SpsF